MEEEIRTIFFNGPQGHRWVTTVAPTDESPATPPPRTDERAADRRRFFGFLNAMRARLERHGVSADDVRAYYAKRFAADDTETVHCPNPHSSEDSQPNQRFGRKMSVCSQREWAIAAAEVQAMFQSPEIFAERITAFKVHQEDVMPKRKTNSIEIGFGEKLSREGDRCKRAILNRLYAAPARIEDLDALGFSKALTNRVLYSLLHQERVTFHGFTYFYHYLRSLKDKSSTERI